MSGGGADVSLVIVGVGGSAEEEAEEEALITVLVLLLCYSKQDFIRDSFLCMHSNEPWSTYYNR